MSISLSIELKLEHETSEVFVLGQSDIVELCMGNRELCIIIIQIWLTYMHRLCIDLGKSGVYGFIGPCFIQSEYDSIGAQKYIQNKLQQDQKECYLLPYLNNCHWQLLVICPKKNTIVFLCSLGWKPNKNITHIVDLALGEYNKSRRLRKNKPTWSIPICQRQPKGYECGYYIMIHMLNIVSSGLVDSWMRIFGESKPFEDEEMMNV
ncbi:uncharacterized protein [Cicer arietinum]|uniref:Uncharacterized protein LOC105852695 isoform X1 n=1 Tax=Cicer arietinum TaxID=3827 RepID=A0A3Q7YH12_CICAR|nr:uncharacterized protein LOC105852695 isoform X1 [Cicer arietinum]